MAPWNIKVFFPFSLFTFGMTNIETFYNETFKLGAEVKPRKGIYKCDGQESMCKIHFSFYKISSSSDWKQLHGSFGDVQSY